MKHDKSHALQDALLNAVDQFVTDLIMGNVSPPEEYICIVEKGFAQTLIGVVKVANACGETFVLLALRNGTVNTNRVNPCDVGVKLLVAAFVPDGYLCSSVFFHSLFRLSVSIKT